MIQLVQNMNSFTGRLAAKIPALCLLARLTFAAVLLVCFGGIRPQQTRRGAAGGVPLISRSIYSNSCQTNGSFWL